MKKLYSKPTAELVDFSLSANIASCGGTVQEPPGVFGDAINGCLIIDGETDCYHLPVDGNSNVFS